MQRQEWGTAAPPARLPGVVTSLILHALHMCCRTAVVIVAVAVAVTVALHFHFSVPSYREG